MLELSTTATFDRLFSKLPKSVQRKAATKSDSFGRIFFTFHSVLKSLTRSITKSGAFESIARTASSLNLSVPIVSNYGSLVTTTPFMTMICLDNLTPGTTSAKFQTLYSLNRNKRSELDICNWHFTPLAWALHVRLRDSMTGGLKIPPQRR